MKMKIHDPQPVHTHTHTPLTAEERVRVNMGEVKCALYLGAIFSTLFRIISYVFLRVVCPDSPLFFVASY